MKLQFTGQVRAILSYLRGLQADVDRIMDRAGIDPSDPNWRLNPVPLSMVDTLWGTAAQSIGSPTLGLHVARAWMNETDAGARAGALRFGNAYTRSILKLVGCLDETGEVWARWNMASKSAVIAVRDVAPANSGRYRSEYTLALLAIAGRRFFRQLKIIDVHFEHDFEASLGDYETILGVTPEFRQQSRLITLRCAESAPSRKAGSTEAALIESVRGDRMRRDSESAVLDLKQVLLNAGGTKMLSLNQAARKLGLGPRTLQRRLQLEGVSYRDVLDDVRETVAKQLLTMQNMEVPYVADKLGFAEVSTFRRAFRRWTGGDPDDWR